MLSEHQQCPRCGGAIATQDLAVESLPGTGKELTLLFCDFCLLGIETLWTVFGGARVEDFSLEFDEHKPVELGRFLQRLKDRRVA